MSHAFRGRALELAIGRAAREYHKEGRALLVRQNPPVGTGEGGRLIYVAGAPVDFLGARTGGRALAIEAKETATAMLPLSKWPEHERAAMAALDAIGVECYLVVDFSAHGEVYRVPWIAVGAFLVRPWRASLSLDWCRMYGLWLPDRNPATDRRRVLWLDGELHPERAASVERVDYERARSPVIDLSAPEEPARPSKRARELAARSAARPSPQDKEAYQEYLRGIVAESVERQAVETIKARKWGKKRG